MYFNPPDIVIKNKYMHTPVTKAPKKEESVSYQEDTNNLTVRTQSLLASRGALGRTPGLGSASSLFLLHPTPFTRQEPNTASLCSQIMYKTTSPSGKTQNKTSCIGFWPSTEQRARPEAICYGYRWTSYNQSLPSLKSNATPAAASHLREP